MSLEESVSMVSPGAYVVSDGVGDVGASAGQGLFYRDTRHLSGFSLKINGVTPDVVGRRERGTEGEFFLAAPAGGVEEGLGVLRTRKLGYGMREEVLISNRTGRSLEVRVGLRCAADFKDVFEVRGYERAAKRGSLTQEVGDDYLRFVYRRGGFWRGTVMRASSGELRQSVEPGAIFLDLRLSAGEERVVNVEVALEEDGEEVRPSRDPGTAYVNTPVLETGWPALQGCWERSLKDLKLLELELEDGIRVPAAGAPWYMALFGRDSLITGYQTIPLGPGPAKNILRALAQYQAEAVDDFRDAEPGKILHELRFGELARCGEVPHSPYYGTADATPLFVILLHEVWRWTADAAFVREMEIPTRHALRWILDSLRRDAYISYETRSTAGLRNQGWKDSADAVVFQTGEKAEAPIALCEVQGYAYDALRRAAVLAEEVWRDPSLAAELRGWSGELKARFNRDFWMEDRGYYTLALDGAGRRVDSITSNPGHLLWSGIVSEDRARAVADRLMGEELFSGWGVRTMAVGEGGYDPESYHNGSVWPHDNALIAFGLGRYGFWREAYRVATAILDAAPHFDHRLPEVFAGYSRDEMPEPFGVPRSCSPQAWAAGTAPLLLRAMFGLEPDLKSRRLRLESSLLGRLSGTRLRGVPAFRERHDLRAG